MGESLNSGDIFINKYAPVQLDTANTEKKPAEFEYKPRPEAYKGANPAYVDRVIMTSTQEDPFLVKVITR